MEDTLKRLLETEAEAERMVEAAKAAHHQTMEEVVAQAQAAEKAFVEQIPRLHADFLTKAEQRAARTLGELKRRYVERCAELRELAAGHEDEALDAALKALLELDDSPCA